MRQVWLSALSIALCVTVVSAGQRPALTPSSAFADILNEYQLGDPRRAVEALAGWDDERLAAEAVVEPGEERLVPRAAVALLLTESGMASRRFGRLGSSASRFHELRGWGLEPSFEVHAWRAHTLIDGLAVHARDTDDAELRAWVKSWYILTTSYCLEFQLPCRLGLYEKGVHHADRDDPEVMLWRGSMQEPGILTREFFTHEAVSIGYGQESRYWYRKALERNPMLVEARLRLGRSLHVTQNDPDAAAILERTLSDALQVNHVFAAHLAALTLGEIHEDNDRLPEAIPYYRQAVGILRGHTASVALGLALVRTGQREEGWAVGREMFGTKGPGTESVLDPWAVYRSAQYWQSASRITEMRKAIRGGRP